MSVQANLSFSEDLNDKHENPENAKSGGPENKTSWLYIAEAPQLPIHY